MIRLNFELMDVYDFYRSGAVFAILLIAAGLFVLQGVFALLLWRKGEKKYFLRFIVYFTAAFGLIIAAIGNWQVMFYISEEIYIAAFLILFIVGFVATGITAFLAIRDIWFSKEEKA